MSHFGCVFRILGHFLQDTNKLHFLVKMLWTSVITCVVRPHERWYYCSMIRSSSSISSPLFFVIHTIFFHRIKDVCTNIMIGVDDGRRKDGGQAGRPESNAYKMINGRDILEDLSNLFSISCSIFSVASHPPSVLTAHTAHSTHTHT